MKVKLKFGDLMEGKITEIPDTSLHYWDIAFFKPREVLKNQSIQNPMTRLRFEYLGKNQKRKNETIRIYELTDILL